MKTERTEIWEESEIPKSAQLAREFIKCYARFAWLDMVGGHLQNQLEIKCKGADFHRHSDELLDEIDWLGERIFSSWQGQTVQAIYYQMQDMKVELTRGHDIWHQDDVFAEVVEEVLRENPVSFYELYWMD